ncbi:MAG: MlaE family lipid ABC transporter permease subunit [Sphingomonadaceae bacterium]|nr:MlaE family lipid ABC transporter permease subunit [Sphingomonadaceae bacterium]
MRADFSEQIDGESRVLRFTGRLTVARIGDLPARLDALEAPPRRVDLSAVQRVDTIGAWLIHRLVRDHGVRVEGASPEATRLIEQVGEGDVEIKMRPEVGWRFPGVLSRIGASTMHWFSNLKGLLAFFGGLMIAIGQLAREPRRFRYNAVVQRFETVGVASLGIVGLMSFLIGIVIAQQGAIQLRQFGAEIYTINLVGRITTRELGVLMTAIMVAGRSGSAFAAQLGSMKLAEEVDAMRTIGVSPMEALVLPRVLATTLMMPLLAFYATFVMIFGAGLLCWITLEIPPATYVIRMREVVPLTDLWIGLIKAPIFGILIGLVGCYNGMQVQGNNEEVGLKTTAAVVQGIFLVIVLDASFAMFFASIGWV